MTRKWLCLHWTRGNYECQSNSWMAIVCRHSLRHSLRRTLMTKKTASWDKETMQSREELSRLYVKQWLIGSSGSITGLAESGLPTTLKGERSKGRDVPLADAHFHSGKASVKGRRIWGRRERNNTRPFDTEWQTPWEWKRERDAAGAQLEPPNARGIKDCLSLAAVCTVHLMPSSNYQAVGLSGESHRTTANCLPFSLLLHPPLHSLQRAIHTSSFPEDDH